MIRALDAWVLRRLLCGQDLDGDPEVVSESFKALVERLAVLPVEDRKGVWDAYLDGHPDRKEIIAALAAINPLGPPPDPEPRVVRADEWPALRLGELPPVEPFPINILPESAACLVEAASGAVGCDPGMVAGPVIAIAGGIIGRSASLLIGSNWFASACVFQANIALPGDGKTHALNYSKLPLEVLEQELTEAFEAEKKRYLAQRRSKDDPDEEVEKPVPRRLLADDMTMEAAFRVLAHNPRGLVMPKGELSTLILGMDQYRRGRGNDRPNLLKVWDGDGFTIDRVGAGEFGEPVRIPHPHLCIAGNLPPDMLRAMVNPRGDDGFIDRWLFSYPDRRPKLKPSQRRPVSNAVLEEWTQVARRLWDRPMDLEKDRRLPHVIYFANAAKAEFDRHWEDHVEEMNAPDFPDALRGAWSKLETYAGRLCLILTLLHHAANPTADPLALPLVEPAIARHAWRLVSYFKSHTRRVRAALAGRGLDHEGARLVLNWVRNHPAAVQIPQSELTRTYPRFREDRALLDDGLAWLVRRNAIRLAPAPDRPKGKPGPKPAPVWDLHPDLRRSTDIPENPGDVPLDLDLTSDQSPDSPDSPDAEGGETQQSSMAG